MLVKNIVSIIEFGTRISVYNGHEGELLLPAITLNNNNIDQFSAYMDMKVIAINTSNEDDDIELVVR